MKERIKTAILDDYQDVANSSADWTGLEDLIDLIVFNDHLERREDIIERLLPFEVICVMRERTPLDKGLLSMLPNLRLIISTGLGNASIDMEATVALGIEVKNTGNVSSGAPELTWALLMALARKIPEENNNFKSGKWQTTIGTDLYGKIIGIVGLGNIGSQIAKFAAAFGMKVIAWSQNLTEEKANDVGSILVSRDTLFRDSDFVSIHLALSERTRGIINDADLAKMKPSAYLINTSRGPLINEQALITVLKEKKIAGAALDVFDREPLPGDHPFRDLDNLIGTGHIGYVTEDTYKLFYRDTVKGLWAYIRSRNNMS